MAETRVACQEVSFACRENTVRLPLNISRALDGSNRGVRMAHHGG